MHGPFDAVELRHGPAIDSFGDRRMGQSAIALQELQRIGRLGESLILADGQGLVAQCIGREVVEGLAGQVAQLDDILGRSHGQDGIHEGRLACRAR